MMSNSEHCIVEGCCKPRKAGRKICAMHENRMRRHGSYFFVSILPAKASPEVVIDRYFSKEKTINGCIEYLGAKNKLGYGRVRVEGVSMFAHRFSYSYFVGKIPDGMVICHKCDNPSCVNPDHLFAGSHNDNVQDKIAKGRAAHLQGSQCGRAKLSENDVVTIRAMKMKYLDIAAIFGVSLVTIKEIRARKTWKHL